MSIRVATSSPIAGAIVCGNRGLGVLGSAVPSTGTDGASYLYNDLTLPADANKEVRGLITSAPSGTLFAYEDGSLTYTGPASSFVYRLFVDGVDLGTATATLGTPSTSTTGTLAAVESGSDTFRAFAGDQTVPSDPPSISVAGPNLRIIHNNAADRASLTASSTSGNLLAANMLTDRKGQVHRSAGTSVTYTLTWADPEYIGGVALPACNLGVSATLRVRGYDAVSGGNLLVDSGINPACPGVTLGLWDWTTPLNGNAFAFGGASKAVCWLSQHYAVKRLEIDLSDPGNPAGYIDCARLVAGSFWSPQFNASYGATSSLDDGSRNSRNDAGDLLTDRFAVSESLRLDLQGLPPADRSVLQQIVRSTGVARPVFIALTPDGSDAQLEQDTMIYGKRANSPIAFSTYNAFSHNLTIEGW